MSIAFFNTAVAIGIVAMQIGIVALILGILAKAPFVSWVARYAHILLGVLFIGGSAASFVYQYGFGYEPCLLCWYQRIAIIPIAILSLTGDIRKSSLLRKQVLTFAIIGFLIAIFHNYIDIFPTGVDVCGEGVSCLKRYVYEFGYITIPMMSATILMIGILLPILSKRYPHNDIVAPNK